MTDQTQLDRLLRDVVHARAGGPVPVPGPKVLHALQARGATRRRRQRRRSAGLAAAAAVVAAVALVLTTGAIGERSAERQVRTTGEVPTTLRTPSIGAPADAYVGLRITYGNTDTSRPGLWTTDGHPLAYLEVGDQPLGTGASALFVWDGDQAMVWTVSSGWPHESTVLDAVDLDIDDVIMRTDCSSPDGAPGQVIAVLTSSSPIDEPDIVVTAWVADPATGRLQELSPASVTCDAPQ